MARHLAIVLSLVAALGCSHVYCDCAPCSAGLTLEIDHPPGAPSVSGDIELTCTTSGTTTRCEGSPPAPGAYDFRVTLGGATRDVTLSAERAAAGDCCGCEWTDTTMRVTLDGAGIDASAPSDAGTDARVPDDASATDGAVSDAGASCEPERVEFPMGGELSAGTLCDDVFVCVPDAAAAAAVTAAAPEFDCTSEPSGAPCDAVRCAYRDPGGPSTLDQSEIDAICAVTVIEPPPTRVVCRVYL